MVFSWLYCGQWAYGDCADMDLTQVKQRQFFGRGKGIKIARSTWLDKTKEESVVKQILDWLSACGIPHYRIRERIPRCYRCHAFIGQAGKKGIPDIVIFIPAHYRGADNRHAVFGAFEVKRPSGGVEAMEQQLEIETINRYHGISAFARSSDDVKAAILKAGFQTPI